MPIYVNIPAAELIITPASASGMPLTTLALINVTCGNHFVDSGVGPQVVIVPIPSSGSIMCNITGYSYGKVAWEGVILTMEQSGQVVPITLTIPVSGYYIPGIGFVPTITYILLNCSNNDHNNTDSDTADRVQQLEKKETSRTTGSA
jgi:hypothetical protein